MEQIIIDVREQDEFEEAHIPGSICVPLSRFGREAPGLLKGMKGKKVLLMCRSGIRADMALKQLPGQEAGKASLEVYPGGILQWARLGKPVTVSKASASPLMRQAKIAAGLVVMASVLLGLLVDERFAWGAVFIGGVLIFAGLTGLRVVARLLAFMPWNRGAAGA